MFQEQIQAMYQSLMIRSEDQERMRDALQAITVNHDNFVEYALFTPMFSMGMSPATILPRIQWLKDNGWDLDHLANASDDDVAMIEASIISTGTTFGMVNRIKELVQRAQDIYALGQDEITNAIKPRRNWDQAEFLTAYRLLQRLHGIGPAAALHVLMDLQWGVVKTDRHICRFLSRLGGPWSEFFPEPGASTIYAEVMPSFQQAWMTACTDLEVTDVDGTSRVSLTSRQVDILIMWYTQTIPPDQRGWRPIPICGNEPRCRECNVPHCNSRRT